MCFDLTHAPVATAARAAATGLFSMSTRPDPVGSGTVETATRRRPRLRVVSLFFRNARGVCKERWRPRYKGLDLRDTDRLKTFPIVFFNISLSFLAY